MIFLSFFLILQSSNTGHRPLPNAFLSLAILVHYLTVILFTSSIHLSCGLPTILFSRGFQFFILCLHVSLFSVATWPTHFATGALSHLLYCEYLYLLYFIVIPSRARSIAPWVTLSCSAVVLVKTIVSGPYVVTGNEQLSYTLRFRLVCPCFSVKILRLVSAVLPILMEWPRY